jgi:predicted GNAT family N-acyltransferase
MAHPRRPLRGGFVVEPLGRKHDRVSFTCGADVLDHYLKAIASQDVARNAAVCFVLTPDEVTIAGFYTLSQYSVRLDALPEAIAKKLPRYPKVPSTLLGRLAVATQFKGQQLGEFLLLDALYRSWVQSQQIASAAVVVDAKDERTRGFYEHFGFIALPQVPDRLFLPMKTIAQLFD